MSSSNEKSPSSETQPDTSSKALAVDNLVSTQHKFKIGTKSISYTATTGTLVLREESETDGKSDGHKAKASVFFIAYTRDDVKDLSKRPLTFSFNGGPGSASVWMHLGLLGPKRVKLDDEGFAVKPPYELVNNEFSLLDDSDLVFIDPVSTGYSRSVEGEKAKDFHNFTKDIESVGDFIRLYCSRNARWRSPKFIIGESYGTTRAAGLSGYLQERHGMYLNGLMLISSILEFQTAISHPGNDLPAILFLPTYTATAFYHKRLDKKLQKNLRKTLDEVEAFALEDYTLALMKGNTLPTKEYDAIAEKLAYYTGLSVDYVKQTNLRINIHRFCKELLRDERKTVGRIDSRYTAHDLDSAGEYPEFDSSLGATLGAYSATLNDYVREELKFESDLPYEILKGLYKTWSYKEFENRYVNVSDTLRKAMNLNPYMKIIVANGYYDLATPYFATEYTFNHLALEPELQENISMTYYEAGHMMYVQLKSLKQMKADLKAFIADSV